MLVGCSLALVAVSFLLVGGANANARVQPSAKSSPPFEKVPAHGAKPLGAPWTRVRPTAVSPREAAAATNGDPFALHLTQGKPRRSLQSTVSGTIAIDANPVTLTMPNPGDTGELTFSGNQGQRVFFKFTNNTFQLGCSATVDASIRRGGPAGPEIAFKSWLCQGSDYMNTFPSPPSPANDTLLLPATDTYAIVFTPQQNKTGSITTTLYDVPADETTTLVPSQAGASFTFAPSVPGQNATATFQGASQQRVFVYFSNDSLSAGCNDTVDVFIKGTAPPPGGFQTPVRGICQIPSSDYIDTITLPANDTYTLSVNPTKWLTGSITATIYDVPPDATASLTIGGPSQNLTIPVRGQGGKVAFSGTAGQPVKITFTNITLTQSCTYSPTVRIVNDADGATVGNPSSFCIPGDSITRTLPATGSYSLMVDPNGGQVGSVTLTGTASAFQAIQQTFGVCGGRGFNARAAAVCTADPVNSLTGAFTYSETDLSLPSKGLSFAFTRSYTSADPTSGRLGIGWTDPYAASLTIVQPSGDALLHGDEGQQVAYTKQPDGSFVGAPGALSTLTFINGSYKLVRSDQVAYTFNSNGVLQSELDRNGQGLSFSYDGSGRLATVTDSSGHTVTLAYSGASTSLTSVGSTAQNTVIYGYTNGQLTSVTLPDPDGPGPLAQPVAHYTYDTGGRLETVVDPNNHTQVRNLYDATTGRVTQQTDANNKTTNFAWDEATQTATATDANNHVWKDVYQNNVLLKRIDATSKTTTFAYDSGLDITSVTSPDGSSTTSMVYDTKGNLLTATAPPSLGNVQKTLTYDGQNNVKTVTDARNKQTLYDYDSAGNLQSVTLDSQPVASATYNAQGQMLTSTDGNGKTTTYTYDTSGNIASVTAPDPDAAGPIEAPKTTYTYDGMGNVLTRVDPLGNCFGCTAANYRTTYTYDAEGHLLTETDQLGNVTTHTYDPAGNETSIKDARNHTTSYEYDNANHLSKITGADPDGAGALTAPITTYSYDDVGNRITEVSPRGNVAGGNQTAYTTTYGYDASNRLVSVTSPKNKKTTYSYDANGNRATLVDPRGNVQGANPADYTTTYTYDAAGRQLTLKDALNNVTTNHYDSVGNLDWTKDANNHQTSYSYDAAGRILTITAPDGGITTLTYDGNGNLKTRKDGENHTTTYMYDDAGRMTQITGQDPDGAGALSAPVTTYTYDLNGNRLTMFDPNGNATGTAGDGKTTYTYDRANQLKTIAFSDTTPGVTFNYDAVGNRTSIVDGSGTATYVYDDLDRLKSITRGTNAFSYSYDVAGNITNRTYPDSSQVAYTYDEDNRLATVASGVNTTNYAYDAASNLTLTTLPSGNGYLETRNYDRAGRLTEVKNATTASTLSDFVSTLDPVGNPTRILQTGSVTSTTDYTYDANDRLKTVCFQAGTCPGASDPFVRWTYDKVGNRLTEVRPAPTGTINYTYNGLDQMTQAGSTAYTYDQNGNEKSAGTRTFTYDLANRLKTTVSAGTTTTYTYDGDDNRLQASTGSQASKKINFLWDTNRDLPQLALERDGNNTLIRRYLYGSRRISMRTGTSDYYYHYDALGSVRNVTSSAGVTQWTDTYEPFGAIRTETKNVTSAPENAIKFTGEYVDPTGLYYLRARQYDPGTARFLSRDPVELDERQPTLSSYVYVANRPTVMVDPSGMTFEPCTDAKDRAFLAASPNGGVKPPPSVVEVTGELQSCRSASVHKNGAEISVQVSPDGYLAWGIYMDNFLDDFGPWWAGVWVNGRRRDTKKPPRQMYPPHGRLQPQYAPSGALFIITFVHTPLVPNKIWLGYLACRIP
jgi:RHS repeat-associated protein